MQLKKVHTKIDSLQKKHGEKNLCAIYGAGCIRNPKVMFIFMNPTAKNISAHKTWKGMRAPWLGTKNVWKLFYKTSVISKILFEKIKTLNQREWTQTFALQLYTEIANKKVYITNLAKCTQLDARPLKNYVFENYLEILYKEIEHINPKIIITFGNKVSSIILRKPITVSSYTNTKHETLQIKDRLFSIYPVYYPVGQGMRNMSRAIQRIRYIIKGR